MSSYILKHKNNELANFALNEINKCTYFRISTIRKKFIDQSTINEDSIISISAKIREIAKELIELDILQKSHQKTYKNSYKGSLFEAIEEKMDEKYTIIKLKGKA